MTLISTTLDKSYFLVLPIAMLLEKEEILLHLLWDQEAQDLYI